MSKKTIDVRGKACPLPIVITKKAIKEALPAEELEVLLDNEVSKNNLTAYLTESGYTPIVAMQGSVFVVAFSATPGVVPTAAAVCPVSGAVFGDYVLVLNRDEMGGGERELGRTLMRTYINAMEQFDALPVSILCYNSGVKLVDQGSDTAQSLAKLADAGVEIICCGVCVEYYNVSVAAGKIGNMFAIANKMMAATKVIYL